MAWRKQGEAMLCLTSFHLCDQSCGVFSSGKDKGLGPPTLHSSGDQGSIAEGKLRMG